MMALAAVPVVLLAGGGVAVAQTAGAPAGTAVVQQVRAHQAGDCGGRQAMASMTVMARHHQDQACAGTQRRDQEHAASQPGAAADRGMMTRAHHSEQHGQDHGGCGDG